MTTITIERAVLLRALEALRPATAPNGAKRDAAFEDLRAALAAPATAPDLSAAYIGAREDLAIWKKRALEAEETARQLNRALAEEVNGPTFMGEPVLPATAPAQPERMPMTESCRWRLDDEDSLTYESQCGELWSFIDGGPVENRVRYCHGCGKPVVLGVPKP